MNEEITKQTPRDTFLYLLAIITLITAAISFGILVYQFINIGFPDPLNQYFSASNYYSAIRSALASLVVVFPVFFLTSRFLRRDVEANPEKRNLKIRRWLLYLTVFVAALVLIGDLVTLIYNFLQGDLTTAFVLKVVTIFFIAGSILFYYLSELRDQGYPRKVFQWGIIAVVAAAVIYGFFVAGSPQSQRLIRFDDQKVNDLSTIENRIVYNYWEQKGSLPTSLTALNDPISGFTVPLDPQSGQAYEYSVTGARSFQLCAQFNLPSSSSSATVPVGPYGTGNNNWQHAAGRACFNFPIDPTLYPVNPKVSPAPVPIKY